MHKPLIVFLLFLSTTTFAQEIEQWKRFELSFQSSVTQNKLHETWLTAQFSNADTAVTVSGFYDGNNVFKIRFMPVLEGKWQYITHSNSAIMNNKKGTIVCKKTSENNHGIVQIANKVHFKYADGKNYFPIGTTAYAWTHMSQAVQENTLLSLKKSGFNKIRMCVFPKNYDLVKEEPEHYPFVIKENINGKIVWDFEQFNPVFFQQLEKRIDNLDALGIEADLILFHPYDKGRWGFDEMPVETNIRYLKYIVARLASFKNVWWSLANEWDFVKSKTKADWDLLAQTVVKQDPYHHLCSIHGATATYTDYWQPWYSHVSVQDEAPVQSPSSAAVVRNIYQKPVIFDEVGYEGNLKSRWGRYSSEEMTHLLWNGLMGGTYVTHGECFMFNNHKDIIFWAKGGEWKGRSWQSAAFLRQIIEQCPQPLTMADMSRDPITTSAGEGHYLIYFGKQINESWLFNLPAKNAHYKKLAAGTKFKVEIIDTQNMSIEQSSIVFETAPENDYRLYDKDLRRLRLPLKPYIALRIVAIK